jgi:hypothetical protein
MRERMTRVGSAPVCLKAGLPWVIRLPRLCHGRSCPAVRRRGECLVVTQAPQLRLVLATLLLLFLNASAVLARNVDLATVPPRESVQLTIYNSEDLTLVRETRSLSLKKGLNRIQYSWANTLIDPTSVEIRPLEKEADIEVLDTTFPGDKPQHLIWNIESKIEGQVKFQVTYFTSGLSWSADYVLVTDREEKELSLDGYVQVINNSGEDYENAQVRLVVGTINLVEKIQELARRGLLPPPAARPTEEYGRTLVVRDAVAKAEAQAAGDLGVAFKAPEIIKEGLSEYFIYTIEGEQTVPNQWSKRMLSFQARQATFDILYRLRPHEYGDEPVRFFILTNDTEHKLGTTPLPDGLVRVFRNNGKDGLSFLGQQQVKYVPIKEEIELNVGPDEEVVHKRKLMKVERSQFKFDRPQRAEPTVVGWDETSSCREEVRNYKAKPVRMELRHVIPGDTDLQAENAKLHDFQTVEFTVDAKPAATFAWEYAYTQHQGTSAKQNRINLR